MRNKPLYTIGIMAELLGIHQRTLRIYDKEGLLVPKSFKKRKKKINLNICSR